MVQHCDLLFMSFKMFLLPLYFLIAVRGQKEKVEKPSLQFFNAVGDTYTFTFTTYQNIPEFTNNSNLNIVSHYCTNGTWIWYNNQFYKNGGEVISGMNYCGSYKGKEALRWNSLRFVGSPDDIHAQALNLYSDVWLRGNETLILEDREEINIKFNSLMLSGSYNVGLFTGTNYTGFSFCVSAQQSGYHPNDLYSVTWDVEYQLGANWNEIKSIKFNCKCESTPIVENSEIIEMKEEYLID